MGRQRVPDSAIPGFIDKYNKEGKKTAYDYLRSEFGLKYPNCMKHRILKNGSYTYDADKDIFLPKQSETGENVFMSLDDLCSPMKMQHAQPSIQAETDKRANMEQLVHELISDRLLALSRYITMDSVSRTVIIDKTTLIQEGFEIVTH
ncbi:hypothetical protein ACKX2D_09375 [Lachnospiraceae bacterium YH-ros2226]